MPTYPALLALLYSAALVLGAWPCLGASIVSLVSGPPQVQQPLSAWQCNAQDGSATQDGVIVDASLLCNWGLTEAAATPSASCAGAELLVAIGRKEVDQQSLQLVLVRHTEDISWSDPFAAVRTVYEKSRPVTSPKSPCPRSLARPFKQQTTACASRGRPSWKPSARPTSGASKHGSRQTPPSSRSAHVSSSSTQHTAQQCACLLDCPPASRRIEPRTFPPRHWQNIPRVLNRRKTHDTRKTRHSNVRTAPLRADEAWATARNFTKIMLSALAPLVLAPFDMHCFNPAICSCYTLVFLLAPVAHSHTQTNLPHTNDDQHLSRHPR